MVLKICRGTHIIFHLLFANDSFLFFKANQEEAIVVNKILDEYVLAYGQLINLEKSKIAYSKNVGGAVRNLITSFLGVRDGMGSGKYLGFPSIIGRNWRVVFKFIKCKSVE